MLPLSKVSNQNVKTFEQVGGGRAMLENPKYKNGFEKGTPYTIEGAKPVDFDLVHNKRVIHVTNGFYRESYFNGTFELEEQTKSPFIPTIKGPRCC